MQTSNDVLAGAAAGAPQGRWRPRIGHLELAWSRAAQGHSEQSARLLGAALGFVERAQTAIQGTDDICEQATRTLLHAQLDEHTLNALLDEGRNLSIEEAARDAVHTDQ